MSSIVVLLIAVLAVVVAIGLAYLPLRLLLGHMTRNLRAFIQRQRERRHSDRETPERRKVAPPIP
jgi:hypothetical protein